MGAARTAAPWLTISLMLSHNPEPMAPRVRAMRSHRLAHSRHEEPPARAFAQLGAAGSRFRAVAAGPRFRAHAHPTMPGLTAPVCVHAWRGGTLSRLASGHVGHLFPAYPGCLPGPGAALPGRRSSAPGATRRLTAGVGLPSGHRCHPPLSEPASRRVLWPATLLTWCPPSRPVGGFHMLSGIDHRPPASVPRPLAAAAPRLSWGGIHTGLHGV